MYIEKRKRVLLSAIVLCFCCLLGSKLVYAESVIGNYRSDSLGDVLYFSTEGREKTEVEKVAEQEVRESEARQDAETSMSDTLTPLGVFKIRGIALVIVVRRDLEEEPRPEEWLWREEPLQWIPE